MRVKVDRQGRCVIPLELRRGLGVEHGGSLELTDRGDHLELRRDPASVTVSEGDDGLPLVTLDDVQRITNDEVLAALEQDRASR